MERLPFSQQPQNMMRFDNELEELNNVDVDQLKNRTPTPQTYSVDSQDNNREDPIEMPKIRIPQLIFENSNSIAKFSNLSNDVNKFMGLLRIVKRETKLLNRIQGMLTFNESQQAQIQEVFNSAANSQGQKAKAIRINAKAAHLVKVYEYVYNHRAYLLDYSILYLGVIVDNFKLLRDLDYRRLLYTSRQISKCKRILLSSVKEGCPSACRNFVMMKSQSNPISDMGGRQMNYPHMAGGNYAGPMQAGFHEIYPNSSRDEEENNYGYETQKKVKYQ